MSLGGTFVQIKSTVADDRSICMATRFSQAASNHERVHKLSVIELSHLVEAIKKYGGVIMNCMQISAYIKYITLVKK